MFNRSVLGLFKSVKPVEPIVDIVILHVTSTNPLKLRESANVRVERSDSPELSDHPGYCTTVLKVSNQIADLLIEALKKDPNVRLVNGELAENHLKLPENLASLKW